MQVIKKYANRKLYHTNRKQYITLEGIAALIQAGEQVQVLDNETGEDITAPILTQVVLQARASGERLPTNVLTGLIQAGGDTIAGMRRSLWSTLGGTSMVDSEISRRLERLRAAGTIDDQELNRLRTLLLEEPHAPPADHGDQPSHHDLARLHAQLDSLTAVVDQLLTERGQRR
jgi:polyhydroxyalkanoate synthesis repressor PhaR